MGIFLFYILYIVIISTRLTLFNSLTLNSVPRIHCHSEFQKNCGKLKNNKDCKTTYNVWIQQQKISTCIKKPYRGKRFGLQKVIRKMTVSPFFIGQRLQFCLKKTWRKPFWVGRSTNEATLFKQKGKIVFFCSWLCSSMGPWKRKRMNVLLWAFNNQQTQKREKLLKTNRLL